MAKLIYSAITSLDGYTADMEGNFDWAAPDEEVHLFINDLERRVGTHLYGRRMYETMVHWETAHDRADQPWFAQDFTRQPCPPRRCPSAARAPRRAPLRQRRGPPPLPHRDL